MQQMYKQIRTSIQKVNLPRWDSNGFWWKFMPPIIVGFHGSPLDFDATQMKRLESNGTAVEPYSLYEAQLRKRLGYVPSWLSSLK